MSEEAWPCPEQRPGDLAEILAAAAWAPFHKPAGKQHRSRELAGIEPWRCYALDAEQCRALRLRLIDAGDATKIPQLLAVADYLIQVTWLPESKQSEDVLFDPSIQNMEHIAAASSAIQSMLLAATDKGIPNYWSSGGRLRAAEVFELLEIPAEEILLGSVFFFPKDLAAAEVKPGALRESRGAVSGWSRSVVVCRSPR